MQCLACSTKVLFDTRIDSADSHRQDMWNCLEKYVFNKWTVVRRIDNQFSKGEYKIYTGGSERSNFLFIHNEGDFRVITGDTGLVITNYIKDEAVIYRVRHFTGDGIIYWATSVQSSNITEDNIMTIFRSDILSEHIPLHEYTAIMEEW